MLYCAEYNIFRLLLAKRVETIFNVDLVGFSFYVDAIGLCILHMCWPMHGMCQRVGGEIWGKLRGDLRQPKAQGIGRARRFERYYFG